MLNSLILVFIQNLVLKEQHFRLIFPLRQSMALVRAHSNSILLMKKIKPRVISISLKRKNQAHILKESNFKVLLFHIAIHQKVNIVCFFCK
jgi:hypothetical protein